MLAAAKAASASPCNRSRRLPRGVRLSRREEFQRVYRRGLRASGQFMVVFALPRDGDDGRGRRLGVTASRRVGGAVARARCRRRLRELFRIDPERCSGRDVDIVLNARHGCATAPWDHLWRDYERCMRSLDDRLSSG